MLRLTPVALLFALAAIAQAGAPQVAINLFDGQSLDGWTVENGCKVTVEDGLLVLKQGNGWLRSDYEYGDFRLHVEWKAVKPADYDAGVYVRTQAGGAPFPKVSHQVNLLQGSEGAVKNIPGATAPAGLVKPGEWNSFDITCLGDTLAVTINGQEAYKVPGLKQKKGYIGLQCEVDKGGEFHFRNLHVSELGYQSLFNGKDLSGWEGGGAPAEQCWEVENGLLKCTGQKGPWLRSAKEYGDFSLRFDYQLEPGGNSGVYVRVPQDGNHHRENAEGPPAGFEVQLLDDAADQYKTLKDYQYSASVYDILGAKPRNSRPAGQWNTIEIACRGQHVQIQHNGVRVADCSAEKYPLLNLRQTKGFLGLQNHSSVVRFRNVRVAELR